MILIDNGHGVNTLGKRSPVLPDGRQLFEYKWNRECAHKLYEKLIAAGMNAKILVPEEIDISLPERCRRANQIYEQDRTSFLISIHVNAAGNGNWTNATGWSAYTSVGNTLSDKLATILYDEAKLLVSEGITNRLRMDTRDGDADIEENFYILKHTNCPAVLTENLFMDNLQECEKLLTAPVVDKIAEIHCNAIKRFSRL